MYNQWRSDFQISSDGSPVGHYTNIKSDTTFYNISMPYGLVDEDTTDDEDQVQEESNKIDSQLMTTIQEEELNPADSPSLVTLAPGFRDSNKVVLPLLQGGIGSVTSTTGDGMGTSGITSGPSMTNLVPEELDKDLEGVVSHLQE